MCKNMQDRFILVIKGKTQYEVINRASDEIARAFEKYTKYDVKVLDVSGDKEEEKLVPLLEQGPIMVFSFSGLFMDATLIDGKTPLYYAVPSIFFAWFVDHPYWNVPRLENVYQSNIYEGFVDRSHVDYIKHFYHPKANAFYIPHGGFLGSSINNYQDRDIDILFSGSFSNPDKLLEEQTKVLSSAMQSIIKGTINILIEDTGLKVENALTQYLDLIKIDYNAQLIKKLLDQTGWIIDRYMRGYYRRKIISLIVNSGISMTVCGNGWQHFDDTNSNLKVLPPMSIDELTAVMGNSKIVLNIMPGFKNGFHERIATAMRNGAVCLTDKSGYLMENFKNEEEIVYYDLNELDNLPTIIKKILDDDDYASGIAKAGKAKADSEYKWEDSARKILECVDLPIEERT